LEELQTSQKFKQKERGTPMKKLVKALSVVLSVLLLAQFVAVGASARTTDPVLEEAEAKWLPLVLLLAGVPCEQITALTTDIMSLGIADKDIIAGEIETYCIGNGYIQTTSWFKNWVNLVLVSQKSVARSDPALYLISLPFDNFFDKGGCEDKFEYFEKELGKGDPGAGFYIHYSDRAEELRDLATLLCVQEGIPRDYVVMCIMRFYLWLISCDIDPIQSVYAENVDNDMKALYGYAPADAERDAPLRAKMYGLLGADLSGCNNNNPEALAQAIVGMPIWMDDPLLREGLRADNRYKNPQQNPGSLDNLVEDVLTVCLYYENQIPLDLPNFPYGEFYYDALTDMLDSNGPLVANCNMPMYQNPVLIVDDPMEGPIYMGLLTKGKVGDYASLLFYRCSSFFL